MKHFIIVASIILFVLLTFFTPTLIEDASFSSYDYLHDFRRTSHALDDDHPNDGWQKDGTFNPIHIIKETKPDGSEQIIKENDYSRYRDNIDNIDNRDRDNIVRHTDYNRDRYRDKDNNNLSDHRKNRENDSKTETNLLPYLLIILLLLVIVIIAVKYNYRNINLINEQR